MRVFESFESFYSKTKPLAGVQVKNIQTYKQHHTILRKVT